MSVITLRVATFKLRLAALDVNVKSYIFIIDANV